jgi:hypothetical protein
MIDLGQLPELKEIALYVIAGLLVLATLGCGIAEVIVMRQMNDAQWKLAESLFELGWRYDDEKRNEEMRVRLEKKAKKAQQTFPQSIIPGRGR